jgi:hypothetical protein
MLVRWGGSKAVWCSSAMASQIFGCHKVNKITNIYNMGGKGGGMEKV